MHGYLFTMCTSVQKIAGDGTVVSKAQHFKILIDSQVVLQKYTFFYSPRTVRMQATLPSGTHQQSFYSLAI